MPRVKAPQTARMDSRHLIQLRGAARMATETVPRAPRLIHSAGANMTPQAVTEGPHAAVPGFSAPAGFGAGSG